MAGAGMEEGIEIILTPLQLAAVLEGETVNQGGSVGQRLIGGLRVLGCAVEVTAGGALLLTPEPTMLSKLGGGALVVHGADQCQTGARQIWTGRDTRSLSDLGASAAARGLGASETGARYAGMAAEFAVPIGTAVLAGAMRAGTIRAGRISLAAHEAQPGARIGGHTISRHVGQSEAAMRTRLAGMRRKPTAISSFHTLAQAEQSVSTVLRTHRTTISTWARSNPKRTLPLVQDMGREVGRGVVASTGQLQSMSRVRVVLKYETYNGRPYYVLTAFPIP
ncbi:MAG: RNase A-like domain-containing protein [Paracoccus sp. (in: a-proteobacteria)]|nr:RNase A-like domain-containing protein [Paracoccus sp. (in: a-proteobacteria)]